VLVFPGYTLHTNDYGPGSMPTLTPFFAPGSGTSARPPAGAAWDGSGGGSAGLRGATTDGDCAWVPSSLIAGFRTPEGGGAAVPLPCRALPGNLHPATALAWTHSRVYLLDSWTGTWTAVSPSLSVRNNVGALPHGKGTLVSVLSASGIAVPPRGGGGGGGSSVANAPMEETKKRFLALSCPLPRSNFSTVLWEGGDVAGCCEHVPAGPAAGLPVPVRDLPPLGGPPVVCYLHHVVFGGVLQQEVVKALAQPSRDAPQAPQEFLSSVHVCVTRVETA
jgi:hypothetical protein